MKQGWEIKKLGDVCLIERGGSPRPIKAFLTDADNGINWIKIGDASENSKYITSTKEKIIPEGMKKSRFVHKGDFLLSNSMSFGRPYILAVDGCIHDGWLVIHDNDNRFDKSYLYYYLGSPNIYNEFKRLAVGGVVSNLNSELVRNVKVSIPPIAEQERIVGELDCLSGIIAAKRAQLRELDTLAQSIFYTMFGDPITNDKGWQTKALGDVARIINGYAFDSKLFSTDKNDMPLIRIRDIKKGYTETFYKGKYPNTYIIKNGDYIIGMDGEFNIVEWRGGTALLNQRVCKIEFIDDEVIGRYALRFLSIELKRIEDATSFVTVKHLSSKSLISIFIPIPPIDLQKQFAEKIENIERQKELITKSIKETEDLFNSRMSYYFE